NLAIAPRRRISAPMWGTQPSDTPAFLINQDGHIIPRDLAEFIGERAKLRRCLDIAPEDDEAPRLRLPEKALLVFRELQTGTAVNGGPDRHYFGLTRQACPFAFNSVQSVCAADLSR